MSSSMSCSRPSLSSITSQYACSRTVRNVVREPHSKVSCTLTPPNHIERPSVYMVELMRIAVSIYVVSGSLHDSVALDHVSFLRRILSI